jgi:glycerate 2-kinase
MNILVAPNSFKECADSVSISKIITKELINKNNYNLIFIPLSDGGDGFLNTYQFIYKAKPVTYYIRDHYLDQLVAYRVIFNENSKSIWIESAELFGLKVIEKSRLNPLKINSEVLGKLLLLIQEDVLNDKMDVDDVFIGIGGTATIDFGLGACSQNGLTLFDESRQILDPIPMDYDKVKSYSFKNPEFPFKIKCIVDVETNLLGEPNAIEIYGKQKGASDPDLIMIKKGIQNIVSIINNVSNTSKLENLNGAGGGLAAGLNIFLGAEIVKAEDFIKNYLLNDIDFDKIDAVITGEGNIDFQSFEGKGVGVILKLFKKKNIPIFIVCGSTSQLENIEIPKNVSIIRLMDFFKDRKESIDNFELGLAKATKMIINQLFV